MRSTLINIALLCCSIVVTLLFLEGALRLFAAFEPCRALGSIPDKLLWQVRPPHQDFSTDCGEYQTHYTTNSSGFRGPEFPPKSHQDTKRIVVLGDSFVEAIEVEESERFARLIDSDLGEQTDAVIIGFRGSSPVHALAHYKNLATNYNPDVVVHSFYSVNDIIETDEDFVNLHPHENWRLKLGRSSLLVQLLYDRVYRPIALSGQEKEKKTARQAVGPFFKFTKEGYADLEKIGAWEYTRNVMRNLKNEVENDGAELLVVIIPPHFLVHEERKEEMRTMLGEYVAHDEWDFTSTYDRLLLELREEGIKVIDPLSALQEEHSDGDRLYFAVDPHINALGHRTVADVLTPVIAAILGL
tara:strand:+ start:4225 stop:5295 length:1071 start_codon:yes stop_codon:yes gene_type:complete